MLLCVLLLPLSALAALSPYSPQDLLSRPKYSIVLRPPEIDHVRNSSLFSEIPPPYAESELVTSHPSSVKKDNGKSHILKTETGQSFLCEVPERKEPLEELIPEERKAMSELERREERERGTKRGMELLEPLKGTCLYNRNGWFTYSFCHGTQIRQFHEIRPTPQQIQQLAATNPNQVMLPVEDLENDIYVLGNYPMEVGKQDDQTKEIITLSPEVEEAGRSALFNGPRGGGARYLIQRWEGGTECDMTGNFRAVEVQFHCNAQSMDRIFLIREVAICQYIVVIHTPRLCGDPLFAPPQPSPATEQESQEIICKPVVDDDFDLKAYLMERKEEEKAAAAQGTGDLYLDAEGNEVTIPEDLIEETIVVVYDPVTGGFKVDPSQSSSSASLSDNDEVSEEDLKEMVKAMRDSMIKALSPNKNGERDDNRESPSVSNPTGLGVDQKLNSLLKNFLQNNDPDPTPTPESTLMNSKPPLKKMVENQWRLTKIDMSDPTLNVGSPKVEKVRGRERGSKAQEQLREVYGRSDKTKKKDREEL